MYKYILFDLDGTLTDSQEGIIKSLRYAFSELNMECPSDEMLYKFIGPPLKTSFCDYLGYDDALSEKLIKKYRERYVVKGLYENKPFDGIPEMLEKLVDDGRILAVATTKPEYMAKEVTDYFGLTKYFSAVCGSDAECDNKASVIRKVFERLSVDESEKDKAIMVGDRKFDIEGAHQCGIRCMGVTFGFAPEGELEEYNADYIVKNVTEMCYLFEADV